MRVLVVNAGSSSIKVSLVDADDSELAIRELEAPAGHFDATALKSAIREMETIDAVGHRVVHGGARYSASVRVDPTVMAYLRKISDLAPLHMPAALDGILAVRKLMPRVPAVACFDTSFHSTMPPAAATYAIPERWRERFGIRRFGFHGFSHKYAARRASELLARPLARLRIVTCHLGSGASLAAVNRGRSVDTTMGFTPLEGLVMATRSGTVDPGMLLWLQRHEGFSERQLTDALDGRSGLLGLAGTKDMREVLVRKAAGDERATLALDVYIHRLRAYIASMAAAMNGLDALVFTGGVGENSAPVRGAAAAGLRFLGVDVDQKLNASVKTDADISAKDAAARTLVVRAREDVEVARDVRRLLG
ncbi:MAG TPA: acetate/propionate family kinase [Candidatus Dormibacteraeota bacterium]|nr:acetate/propionate family kinase [Candidatus Dormibacteraeota bacterium]